MPRTFSRPLTQHAAVALLAVLGCFGASPAAAQTAAPAGAPAVTFAKDVAPIIQKSCQTCHRPGQMGPMSLMSYEEVRPWARAIKQNVSTRQMPPFGINPHVGIQKFKDDPRLSDAEIDTIVKWVDAGAPRGNVADMPAPRQFKETDGWNIGEPDLIVTSPPHTVPAEAADWWGSYLVPTGLTEDRYIKAVETKPGKTAVVHHLLTFAVEDDAQESLGDDSSSDSGEFLNEFAVGKNGDVFPEGVGRLLKAGAKVKFDFHYHSVGEATTDQSQVAFKLYPKGYVPPHVQYAKQLGQPSSALDIPAGGAYVRTDGYTRMNKPGKLTAFQPHMHTRGKSQCIELIYPDNKTEQISCADWSFNWHLVYNYADEVQPIYPAGTVLHVMTWHDNTANKGNPDAKNWVGPGNRTIDEMGFAWISWYDLTDEEYQKEFEARKARERATTNNEPGPGQQH